MNLTEFLEELSKTRNGWFEFSHIVRKRGRRGLEQCPITAVCLKVKRRSFDTGDFPEAAEKLGLGARLARRIADAADTHHMEPRLRARLLKAVGLK